MIIKKHQYHILKVDQSLLSKVNEMVLILKNTKRLKKQTDEILENKNGKNLSFCKYMQKLIE